MSGLTRILNRIGTVDSVSWPAFWLTLIAGIIGNFSAVQTGASIQTRVAILAAAQMALFIPLIAMRFIFLQRARRPHPFIVLTGFVIAVVCRALSIATLGQFFFPGDSTTLAARIIGNFLNIGMVLIVTAYVVSLMRERRRQITQLQNLRSELEQSIEVVSSELTQRNEATVDRIRQVLQSELNRLDASNAESSLVTLQETVTNVVRPLSHQLAFEVPEISVQADTTDPVRTRWREVLNRVATGKPFRPILTASFMSLEAIAVLATLQGVFIAMVSMPLMLALLLAGSNLIFERVSTSMSASLRVIFAIVLAVLSGVLVGFGLWFILGSGPRGWALGIGGGVLAAVLAIVVSIGASIARDRTVIISELTLSTQELERSLVRRKQTQWLQNKSISRALHGPVQTAVNAAAIKIDGAIRGSAVPAEMIEGVRADLLASLDVLGQAEGSVISLDQGADRIKATWDGICEVDISISIECHDHLESDVVIRSCFIDIVTEAVSNAVRHGDATNVVITAVLEGGNIILEVKDNGPAVFTTSAPGLGSTQLDDCTLSWTLHSTRSR